MTIDIYDRYGEHTTVHDNLTWHGSRKGYRTTQPLTDERISTAIYGIYGIYGHGDALIGTHRTPYPAGVPRKDPRLSVILTS